MPVTDSDANGAHVRDVARLCRLALEKQGTGGRYHGVAEEGVPVRAIVEVIGRGLNVPVAAVPARKPGNGCTGTSMVPG